ncbi:MAG: glutamate-1-semialdehyde 2,1-aminomutase [Oscillospiraceae bacterium]|nr:glutamate-1-semialdehyde 2,1-aminomutase [Oscillospiraceae bacterium]
MNTTQSEKLYQTAMEYMPGGVNSPVRAFGSVGRSPLFITSASGDRITDADGNTYIDYVCSWGPDILGHAHPSVISAVKAQCENGLTFGACHAGEIELASVIRSHMPSMELIRLVSSGTEAVMSAVRAARGYTGRDLIVKFEGCYHGHSDGLLVKGGSGLLTGSIPNSAGVPRGFTDCTLVAAYNDPDSVEALFAQHPDEIACVIVEPCAANMGVVPPKPGFLEFLREITQQHGALLLFDEVITGFRLGIGGAQGVWGITPDLTALGKIVGGGMPLAAYGGRREIMECVAPLGSVYQAGTLSGNPIAVAAGLATLLELEKHPELYSELDTKTARLADAARTAGMQVNRCGSLMTVFFTDVEVTDHAGAMSSDTGAYAAYFNYLLENGVYTAPSQFEAMFVSAAHTDADIDRTCDLIRSYA